MRNMTLGFEMEYNFDHLTCNWKNKQTFSDVPVNSLRSLLMLWDLMGIKSLWVSSTVRFTREVSSADSARVEMFLSLIKYHVCWGRYIWLISQFFYQIYFQIIILWKKTKTKQKLLILIYLMLKQRSSATEFTGDSKYFYVLKGK